MLWIIADERLKLSTTVVALFRDALMHPDASGIKLNFGNNRVA